MDYLIPKAPGDTVAYFIDWSHQIGDDTLATVTLTVSSGTVTIPQTPDNFGTFIRFLAAGGANGEIATLHCAVTTDGLQSFARDIQLAILSAAESVTPSTCTKQTIVEMAFEEMTLAGYEFDTTNAEKASMLRRLDALMAELRPSLDLGYNFPQTLGQSQLSDASGVPDDAVNFAALSLAERGAAPMGKTLSAESRKALTSARNAAYARYQVIPSRQLPAGTPRGAGQKPYGVWWPYGWGPTTS